MVKPSVPGVPKWAIDHPVVYAPRKTVAMKTSGAQQKATATPSDEARSKQQNLAEWRGPCCDGTHFWGHGKGFDDGRGGRIYKCGNSKCRKLLPRLTPEEQEKHRSAGHCVYCLAESLMANGKMSKEEAKAEAAAIFATVAEGFD